LITRLANREISDFIAIKQGVTMMACPYFLCSKHGSCKVLSGIYQPGQQEKERLCLTNNYSGCEIYHYYQTTCDTPFEIATEVNETPATVLS
jgi:hypothetical protein